MRSRLWLGGPPAAGSVSGAQFLCQEGLPTGSCPGRCGARISTVFAVTTVYLALQAAANDRCAESRSSSTTTTTKTGVIKRWKRSGNASYFDARRSPPTLTVPRSRRRAQSLRIAQWMGPDMGTTGPTGGDPGGRHAPRNALEGGLNVGKEKIDVSQGAASRFQLGRPLCSP